MEEKIEINPRVLAWCREQAGLSLEEAAHQAGILVLKQTKKKPLISPQKRLSDIENGTTSPTFSQLKALSRVYQRPLMTFFLNEPPKLVETLVDFRTINSLFHQKDSPSFARLKRRLLNLQESLATIEREYRSAPLDFVSTVDTSTDLNEFIKKVRSKLKLSYDQQNKAKDDSDLFKLLRDKIQDAGVFVVLEGNLGSHHSNIPSEEFRGISISDGYAPLIAINPNDYKQARLFTLLHEFAHIWLGDSSISNMLTTTTPKYNLKEAFCNRFAAEFLIPEQEILSTLISNKIIIDRSNIFNIVNDLAHTFKVSLMVMSRRLYDLGRINNALYNEIVSAITRSVRQKKELNEHNSDFKVKRNTLDRYRLGNKVISTVLDATYNGKMSLIDASILLNVNTSRLGEI